MAESLLKSQGYQEKKEETRQKSTTPTMSKNFENMETGTPTTSLSTAISIWKTNSLTKQIAIKQFEEILTKLQINKFEKLLTKTCRINKNANQQSRKTPHMRDMKNI